jgi:hypothetical protein
METSPTPSLVSDAESILKVTYKHQKFCFFWSGPLRGLATGWDDLSPPDVCTNVFPNRATVTSRIIFSDFPASIRQDIC